VTSTPTPPALDPVDEIGQLLAWCRRLSEAGPSRVDPAELAAYQAAKTQLLARIADGQINNEMNAGGA
jgi:hypothetical protein